jgi:NAD+ synthetase
MQARIRGRIVMEYANDSGLLMLTTGNKSELAVGYATLYGDMCGALNCIGDLYKNDVYALSNYINEKYGELIPQSIIDKAPSAELAEGQKDADSLPDYFYLDAMLKLYLERDLLAESEIKRLQGIVDQVEGGEQKRIYRMVELAEFKRKQAPQILFIQRRPFGIGRRMPTTARFNK